MSNKLKIEIKNRFTGSVLFEYEKEDNTVRDTVIAAVESDANLSGADLSGADLRDADLSDANLSGADLSGATIAYSDSDLDEQSVAKDFAANAQLDSLETEMRHGIKSARNWWAFRWKNVVKIKSWKLKDGSATSGQNPDNSTPESGDLSGQKTQSEKQEEQKFAIAVAAAGIRHQDMLALKKAAEDIPLLDGAKLTITYRNI